MGAQPFSVLPCALWHKATVARGGGTENCGIPPRLSRAPPGEGLVTEKSSVSGVGGGGTSR